MRFNGLKHKAETPMFSRTKSVQGDLDQENIMYILTEYFEDLIVGPIGTILHFRASLPPMSQAWELWKQ